MQYLAKFIDAEGIKRARRFMANHITHAQRKAFGIGKSNGWTVLSVGKI